MTSSLDTTSGGRSRDLILASDWLRDFWVEKPPKFVATLYSTLYHLGYRNLRSRPPPAAENNDERIRLFDRMLNILPKFNSFTKKQKIEILLNGIYLKKIALLIVEILQ